MPLETTHERHRSSQVSGVHRILPLFHQGLLENRTPSTTTNSLDNPLDLGRKRANGIRNIAKSYDRQTSTMTTRLCQTILPTHRRIGIWRGSHTLTGGRIHKPRHQPETETPPSRILLCDIHGNQAQLRHLQVRTVSNHEGYNPLETLPNLD